MTLSALSVLFISWIVSFSGSLPFGPINLVMIDTTLKNSLRAGIPFAIAAAFVEMGQSWVALYGSVFFNQFIAEGPWFRLFGFVVFSALGLVFFFKKNQESTFDSTTPGNRFFLKGFFIALLNPQAIPFWIIVLALLQSAQIMQVDTRSPLFVVLAFMLGAALGKLTALLLFGILSRRIIYRMTRVRQHLNRIIGIILITIGMVQAILAFTV
ncbi:MAG TPA: LysE family transporter [Saprospiraceae bacterium]|nr:LysE family transporter [Saprospiraceae bacterium]HMP26147.1 LysE family transporter [Saprospiraceae bacterium]